MYKAKLVSHCAKGEADGSCEIGKGKPLQWVAEQLEWTELKLLLDKLSKLSEQI